MSIGSNRDKSEGGLAIKWSSTLEAPYLRRTADKGEAKEAEDILFSECASKGARSILACWVKPKEWKKGPWKDADGKDRGDPYNWELRARAVL